MLKTSATLKKVEPLRRRNTAQELTLFTKVLVVQELVSSRKQKLGLKRRRNEDEKVWVIGVDRDQVDEGKYTSKDGKESNFVLASTLKQLVKLFKKSQLKLLMANSQVEK